MVTVALFPEAIVTGKFNPWMTNSELFDWSDEIVTEPCEAVRVACFEALDPTLTFPKLRVAGLTARFALL